MLSSGPKRILKLVALEIDSLAIVCVCVCKRERTCAHVHVLFIHSHKCAHKMTYICIDVLGFGSPSTLPNTMT